MSQRAVATVPVVAQNPSVRATPIEPARRSAATAKAGPVVKWAGGKTRLLSELEERLPADLGAYFEPFFGGGALFFRLLPERACVGDVNAELINLYRCVRDDVDALIEDLHKHVYSSEYYYWMRGRDPLPMSDVERASRIVYLNRTCFNGLYRVNRRGQFNVPFGSYTDPVICQEDKLRASSVALRGVQLKLAGYKESVAGARAGDFVYFDPPYQPVSATSNFTSYTAAAFDEDDQAELAETFAALDARGVRCMLSNSDAPLIHELYAGFRIDIVHCARAISRRAAGRGPVPEVVVRNY